MKTEKIKKIVTKGDIFDIKLTNKTMTHPTLGPLFGSFKLQHFIFTAGFRLYNSWLHNNRTGIGMKMSDIKLPMILRGGPTDTKDEIKYNPSSLYSYLGWKGCKQTGESEAGKNATPWLIYLDIFKNYFANTQEDKFYIIAGSTEASITIDQQNQTKVTVQVGADAEVTWQEPMGDKAILTAGDSVKDYASFWKSVKIKFYNPSNRMSKESYINYLTSNSNTKEITTDKMFEFLKENQKEFKIIELIKYRTFIHIGVSETLTI